MQISTEISITYLPERFVNLHHKSPCCFSPMFSCTRISNIQLNTIVQFVEKITEIYKIYTGLPSGA